LPIDETPFDFGERRDAACFFGATLRQGGTDLSIPTITEKKSKNSSKVRSDETNPGS
jgi:hypothetical protein